jgi:hypothetical protein
MSPPSNAGRPVGGEGQCPNDRAGPVLILMVAIPTVAALRLLPR